MTHRFADITFTDSVIAAQEHYGSRARNERVVFIDVVAFDWNCPQHITRRYTEAEYAEFQRKVSQ
jgi:hypothetical protein